MKLSTGLRSTTWLVLAASIVLFSVSTTYMNWAKYISLRSTDAYDLGSFHNNVFNISQGRSITYFLVSAWFDHRDHDGPSVFRQTHFSPMQSLLVPQLYRLYPDILTLMLLQSVLLALGALPLYWLAVRMTARADLSLVLALSYLFHPATLHLAFNDYRTSALGLPLALYTLWFHSTRRWIGFVVAAVLMLACRSEYVFLLALFGLINWRLNFGQSRSINWAVAPLVIGAVWAGLTMAYYFEAFGRPWPLTTYAVGSGQPAERIDDVLLRLPVFFRIGLLPAAVALLVPEAFLVAVPFVAAANSVQWPAFPHDDLQHLSPALAVVFWAFARGAVRLWQGFSNQGNGRVWLLTVLSIAALASLVEFGWGAAKTYLIGGFPRYETISGINASLPVNATVIVPESLAARFSNHARVITQPRLPVATRSRLSDEDRQIIFARLIFLADLVATERGQEWLGELIVRSARYKPAQTVGDFQIFLARDDAIRPEDPDALLHEILRWDRMSETELRWVATTGR